MNERHENNRMFSEENKKTLFKNSLKWVKEKTKKNETQTEHELSDEELENVKGGIPRRNDDDQR